MERDYALRWDIKYLDKWVEEGKFTKDDADLVREFFAEVGMGWKSTNTAYGYGHVLILWRKYLPPFRTATATDIFSAIAKFQSDGFTEWTMAADIGKLKRFMVWLVENEYSTIPMKKLLKIKVLRPKGSPVTEEDVIPREVLEKALVEIKSVRNRAMLALMYDGALRVIELGKLRWKHVRFDQYGVILVTGSKKGGNEERYIRCVMAKPHLALWKSIYPGDPAGDNFVFITTTGKNFNYVYLYELMMNTIKKTSIDPKKFHPYLCRHSKITHMVQAGMQETIIKQLAWGNIGTGMMRTYTHLSNEDIDNSVLAGVVREKFKKEQKALLIAQCKGCGEVNPGYAQFCYICGRPLTEDAEQTLEDKIAIARRSDDYKKKVELIDS